MIRFLLKLSIGKRLKFTISVLVSTIIIILGIVLYNYQKKIIFEQAKQNSYATIDDLIRFTQNEIDASRDKIPYFGQAAINHLNSLGSYKQKDGEIIHYNATIAPSTEPTSIDVPAIYRGNIQLQSDTTILPELNKLGIVFFIYYQKTDDYFIEIINSQDLAVLKDHVTKAFSIESAGTFQLNNEADSLYTQSHWAGNKWVRIVRLFTRDENNNVNGAIIAGILERNEVKLSKTFSEKKFYQTGICYQVSEKKELLYHPVIPAFTKVDNPAFTQLTSQKMIDKASYVVLNDSIGTTKYLFYRYNPTVYNNVVIEIPEKEMFTSLYALRNGIFIAIVVIIICIYFVITLVSNTITSRLNKAVEQAKSISSGDLTSSILIDSSDELAELGIALNQMNDILKETVSGITSLVETVNETATPAPVAAPKAQKAPKSAEEKKARAPRGTNLAAPGHAPIPCREGSKQAMLLDMLSRPNGATMAELIEALSGGNKPWTEATVRSGFGWDMKLKGYGVRSAFAADGTERFHIVVPEGHAIPAHKPLKSAPKADARQTRLAD